MNTAPDSAQQNTPADGYAAAEFGVIIIRPNGLIYQIISLIKANFPDNSISRQIYLIFRPIPWVSR